MPLQVKTRWVGDVAVLECSGTIVAGADSDVLMSAVQQAAREAEGIVLAVEAVSRVDSSGLGALVRACNSGITRQLQVSVAGARGMLAELIEMTRLAPVVRATPDEATAVERVRGQRRQPAAVPHENAVLCLEPSPDASTLIASALAAIGFAVHQASSAYDARVLMNHVAPRLLLIGPSIPDEQAEAITRELAPGIKLLRLNAADFNEKPEQAIANLLRSARAAAQ